MTEIVKPRMDILPMPQQRLWPNLRAVTNLGYVLYGGTAIALRLGHRQSVDFDFFTEGILDKGVLRAALPFLEKSTVLQDQPGTYTVLVTIDAMEPVVKLSFFGGIDFGRVGEPSVTEDRTLQLAALDDLMATKLKVILQRIESRDYWDVAAMIDAGVSLEKGLAAARELFGPAFQPSEALKALTYFEGGDLSVLSVHERGILVTAASRVRGLPQLKLKARRLSITPTGE